ncbi:MAG TPA: hypothetical protein VF407_17345 [Polyangiaceae bacterium]
MRLVALASVVLGASIIVVACSDDKPPVSSNACTENCTPTLTGGGSGNLGDGGTCGFVTVDETCNDCIHSQCCDFDETCFASAPCAALVDCLNGCATNDTICEENCGGANDAGVGAYTDFVNCIGGSCQAQCTATD